MTPQPHVMFRADAGPQLGAGHVMRCLSLAGALKQHGWRATFVVNDAAPGTVGAGLAVADRVITLPASEAMSATSVVDAVGEGFDAAVVDHYGLGAGFERELRRVAKCVMAIDDLADRQHDCDIILDPSPGRRPVDYSGIVPERARRAVGASFALLRTEFAASRSDALERRRSVTAINRILVSFGMTDPTNLTAAAIDAINKSGITASVDVVLGRSAPHLDDVKAKVEKTGGRAELHVSPGNMAALLSRADIAVGAAGGSVMERACLGLPSVTLLAADNQRLNMEAIARSGSAIQVTHSSEVSEVLRRLSSGSDELPRLSENAAAMCDGLGADRAAAELAALANPGPTSLTSRPATDKDAGLLLQWQSASGIRAFSRNPTPPSPSEHAAWMARRLRPQPGLFEIVETGGTPAGVVRLDPIADRQNTYEVSILIAPGHQGKGVGKAALLHVRRLFPWATFEAAIHPDNTASIRIFEATGYEKKGGGYISHPHTFQ